MVAVMVIVAEKCWLLWCLMEGDNGWPFWEKVPGKMKMRKVIFSLWNHSQCTSQGWWG